MQDFEPILDLVGDARLVLIGEATHGTHDFYRLRAQLTRQLIVEKQFCAVAAEADWPDAYRVNRFVRGLATEKAAAQFRRGLSARKAIQSLSWTSSPNSK